MQLQGTQAVNLVMPLVFLHVSYFLIKKNNKKKSGKFAILPALGSLALGGPRQRWWQTEACVPPSTVLLGSGS